MKDGLLDVGKGTILKLKDQLFHRRQLPDNALRVSMASVKAGYEGLPRPIQIDGEDDETPTQLGQRKIGRSCGRKIFFVSRWPGAHQRDLRKV